MYIDICRHKHKGSSTSVEAFKAAKHSINQLQELVLKELAIEEQTMKEISDKHGIAFNSMSGRGSELKSKGKVEETGEIRNRGKVLRIKI